MKLKKVAALGLATAMAFSVTACSSSKPGSGTAAAVLDGWNRGCGEKFMYMCENRMASDA